MGGVLLAVSRGGIPLGIDFTGGTIVVVKFQSPVAEDAVRQALDGVPGEKVVQSYGDPADNQVLIRLPQMGAEEGASLEQGARAVVGALQSANLAKFELLSQEIVGPVIGRELQLKGIYATLASIAGIAGYIALRFRPAFAVGAIAATLHDVIVTLVFLAVFRYDLSLNIVAALLTITGYSVNDTIVIFDRVRENLRGDAARPARESGQHGREPDAEPHGDYRRHDVLVRAVAVSVRRGGAAWLRLHHARRHRERHVFHGLHRRGHRDHPGQPAGRRRHRWRGDEGQSRHGAAFLGFDSPVNLLAAARLCVSRRRCRVVVR